MNFFALSFTSPFLLLFLLALPLIWWLLKLTPPQPRQEVFPPTQILKDIAIQQQTPAKTPWWLTLLRLLMAAAIIAALANPVWNNQESHFSHRDGPLLMLFDDGWTSGAHWSQRQTLGLKLLDEAEKTGQPVALVFTSDGKKASLAPTQARLAKQRLAAATPQPITVELNSFAQKLNDYQQDTNATPFSEFAFLASGLNDKGTKALVQKASQYEFKNSIYWHGQYDELAIITGATNGPKHFAVSLTRSNSHDSLAGQLIAFDAQKRIIAKTPFVFEKEAINTTASFTIPVELRNDIHHITIEKGQTAGHIYLLDAGNQRRKIGLISGNLSDQAQQPLLSPLYYIARALAPFSDIHNARDQNIIKAVPQLIGDNVSTLILTDIGTLPPETRTQIDTWVRGGGLLIRFAGPRLASSENNHLLPTRLRKGNRNLGGTLSWSTPQPLSPFSPQSLFYGIQVSPEVTIKRQVLAEPDVNLQDKTWASLKDGTPLVTAHQQGRGWLVLFHVTADLSWSNLPLSGSFVDMMRRIITLSKGTLTGTQAGTQARLILPEQKGEKTVNNSSSAPPPTAPRSTASLSMPAIRIIDGFGALIAPASSTAPLIVKKGVQPLVSKQNPPGLYGHKEAVVALNLFSTPPSNKDDLPQKKDNLTAGKTAPSLNHAIDIRAFDKDLLPRNIQVKTYTQATTVFLKPWILALALILLTIDGLIVLWMGGALRWPMRYRFSMLLCTVLVFYSMSLALTPHSQAQENATNGSFDITMTLKTHLAYVKTGDTVVDTLSQKGLIGLTRFLTTRTSLEPGPPVGVDLRTDELSYFPLLYWPISTAGNTPDEATMARVDEFMKNGGSVLFDTRDQFTNELTTGQNSAENQKLRMILKSLNIPPLEPVPDNHVLTRSFYLLNQFPGRYLNGQLWVAASHNTKDNAGQRLTRIGDGVSPLMITSNDFASAWAIHDDGQFARPIVPANPRQRQFAFRAGVNIVMYTLTGNYKSDQVHIPALLERLGQ